MMQRRHGFTLAEVVVSAAILGLGAAIAVPMLGGYYDHKRATDTQALLASLSLSLENPNVQAGQLGFLYAVGKYPFRISHLTNKITLNDSSCSKVKYVANDTTAYNVHITNGAIMGPPYSGLPIVQNKGLYTPLGWVHDTVVKGATAGWVELHVDSVSADDAQLLDIAVDGSSTPTTGLVQYATSPTNGSFQLVRYLIPAPVNGTTTKGC
jgi:prepilin-type N-terminal cleavage/methylation domain-containing protein